MTEDNTNKESVGAAVTAALELLRAFFEKGLRENSLDDWSWWDTCTLKTLAAGSVYWPTTISNDLNLSEFGPARCEGIDNLLKQNLRTDKPLQMQGHPHVDGLVTLFPLSYRGSGKVLVFWDIATDGLLDKANPEELKALGDFFKFVDIVRNQMIANSLAAVTETKAIDELEQELKKTTLNLSKSRGSDQLKALQIFAGGISHEFNNQLGVIMGYADLVTNNPSEDNVNIMLKATDSACNRMHQIVQGLRSFSTHAALNPVETDLTEIIDTVLQELADEFDTRNLQVSSTVNSHPPVFIDESMFTMIIRELLLNAIHASAKGGQIRLLLETRDNAICFQVMDSGQGLTAEELQKVTIPFKTTKGALGSGQEEGMGLGLTKVQSALQRHGGQLLKQSDPLKGSLFGFNLPLKARIVEDTSLQDSEIRLLIISTNSQRFEALKTLIDIRQYQSLEITAGVDALNSLASWQPHVLVLDENLSDIQAFDLVATMQSYEQNIPVLLMTDNLSAELVRKAYRANIRHFAGPLSEPEDIESEIHSLLDEKQIKVTRTSSNTLRGLNIAIVDDEPNMCRLLKDRLQAKGHTITMHTEPQEALEQIDIDTIDLVLTDFIMPLMTGEELTRALRKKGYQGDVVWMTGFLEDARDAHSEELGVNSVLTKPISLLELENILNSKESVAQS